LGDLRPYLGAEHEAVLAAADEKNAREKRDHVREANFFTGELMLQRGARDEAGHRFRLTAAECGLWEGPANAELKALGAPR
jgi:hypothetical protein